MGILDIFRSRETRERKARESALAGAEAQMARLRKLRRDINEYIRFISKTPADPTESTFLSGAEANDAAARAEAIFKELLQLERIEKLGAERLAGLIDLKFVSMANEADFKKDLAIEEELDKKTLSLEAMFRRAIGHLKQTKERKNIYHFFGIALKIVDEEISMSEGEVADLTERVRAAA